MRDLFNHINGKLNMPLPETDQELEIISELYFGAPLHLYELRAYEQSGNYQVNELYNSYHGEGFEYSTNCTIGYDHSAMFWRTVCGELTCGGIGSRSYGQFTINNRRHYKRLERWIRNRKNGISYVRKPFERLARKLKAREKAV